MTDGSRLDDLLSLCEQRCSEGQPLSDEELQDLCRQHPEDLLAPSGSSAAPEL